jgi:hypothetical protein
VVAEVRYSHSPHRKSFQDAFERHEFEREYATRLQFEANFDAWLRIRSAEGDEETETNEMQNARCDREDDLAHLILTAPVPYDWMIFRVVDYYLTKHAEASWGELLALTAISAIKTDILRLKEERELEKKMGLASAKAKTVADHHAA